MSVDIIIKIMFTAVLSKKILQNKNVIKRKISPIGLFITLFSDS